MIELNALSNRLIGLATEVHRTAGPGLLESVYRACLCLELEVANIPFQSETMAPVHYRGRAIPLGFLMNFHAPALKDGLRRFIV